MTQILYLADQDFKSTIIKMFKRLTKRKKDGCSKSADVRSQWRNRYNKTEPNGNSITKGMISEMKAFSE